MKRGVIFCILIAAIALIPLQGCADNGANLQVPDLLRDRPTGEPMPAFTAKASPASLVSPSISPSPDTAAQVEDDAVMVPLTQAPAIFDVAMPSASGTDVLGNKKAAIDVSNKRDGYIMVRFTADTDKRLRVIITGPSKAAYTYSLNAKGEYEVYPLSEGNGGYTVGVYENISGNKYSTACTASFDVKLKDEFAPFLRPNQYVNFSASSKAVKKAAELTRNAGGVLDVIAAIYRFVTDNIAYDKGLADSISARVVTEYLPDIDKVLASGKGICFDYAALMTAMLRSRKVPCKLVVGYAGGVYHAWISAYSEAEGWLDGVIYFDGKSWRLMDPTYASSGNGSDEVMEYIGDGENYTAKYIY